MEFPVFAIVFAAILLTKVNCQAHEDEPFGEYIPECLAKYGLTVEVFKLDKFPEDKKCFFHCVGLMSKTINDKGEINVENSKKLMMVDKMPPNIKSEVVKCFQIKTNDKCETAYKSYKCVNEIIKF